MKYFLTALGVAILGMAWWFLSAPSAECIAALEAIDAEPFIRMAKEGDDMLDNAFINSICAFCIR